ncbi:MAG: hypothetical protein NC192_00885 [Muribaculaceae bacterium]|nr:hypothetical protein [Muribaculaceae bacterium]
MNFNRKKHSRFVRYLDETAEKNPLLWFPCVALLALILAGSHIAGYVKMAYSHRNTEKSAVNVPRVRKPFFLRAAAVTMAAAFSLMLVPASAFEAFAEEYSEEYGEEITEIIEAAETEVPEEVKEPEETEEPAETEETEVPVETEVTEEEEEPVETTVTEEKPEETEEPDETEKTEVPDETEVTEEETEETVENEEDLTSDNDIALAADHTHDLHMNKTEYIHWQVCTICQQEFNRSEHDYAITIVNPTQLVEGSKTFTCTFCGYGYTKTLPTVTHDHQYSNLWEYDTNSHWHVCVNANCEAVGDFGAHTPGDWQNDRSRHWRICTVCGKRSDSGYHDFEWVVEADGHQLICDECGYYENKTAHSFQTKYDKDNHWEECSACGYKTGETAHTLDVDNWQKNPDGHRKGCTVCNYSTESAGHSLDWNRDADGNHWQSCSVCGWESAKTAHAFTWTNDGKETDEGKHWEVCACGLTRNEGTHRYQWQKSETNHWEECSVVGCNFTRNNSRHDQGEWHNNETDHWRVCSVDVCGKTFAEGPHVFGWTWDDDNHWEECECGWKRSEGKHDFPEKAIAALIRVDGEDIAVKRFHCTDPNCNYYYDEPIDLGHRIGSIWKYDSASHWHECIYCGRKYDTAAHEYSVEVIPDPNDPTEGTRVYTCTVCGYSYDEPADHTHIFGTDWKYDGSNHWHECISCGEKADTAAHVSDGGAVTAPGVRTYSCTVCGYIIRTEAAVQTSIAVPLRLPYITDEPDFKGWEKIAEYINASPDGALISVTMNGESSMPKDIAECIIGRNVTLSIKMDGNYSWTVNGLDVTNPKTVNLRISKLTDSIPESVVSGMSSELTPAEYRLYHSGDFGFKAVLTLNTASKYDNYYAQLYYYNTRTGEPEFIGESFVSGRQATFAFTHASYYVITYSSVSLYSDVSAGAGIFEGLIPLETSAMPETNGVTLPAVKLPQIPKYSSKKRRYRILKKRRLDDLVFVM